MTKRPDGISGLLGIWAAVLLAYGHPVTVEAKSVEQATPTASTSKRAPVGLEGVELEELESGKRFETKRFILPPYVSEKRDNLTFKTVLPLFYFRERTGKGARRDVGLLPFYWSTVSGKERTHVYFPLYWRIRTPTFNTDVVLQTYMRRGKDGFDFGFAPLFFAGRHKKAHKSYQVVLPPLYWNFKNRDGGFRFSLLYYDFRHKNDFSRGFIPLYFSRKKRDKTVTTILPPLIWHVNDLVNYQRTTVMLPMFFKKRKTGWSAGVLPLLYFARDITWSRNMVLPFYYGSKVGTAKAHYFPLLLSYVKRSKSLRQGGIGPFYHWYREEGQYLDMVSPLFWRYGNKRTLDRNVLVPPLFYHGENPVTDKTMIGMVYWNFNDHHLKKTFALAPLFAHQRNFEEHSTRTWIFPTFDMGRAPGQTHFNLYPVLFVGRGVKRHHLVLAPLWWSFSTSKKSSHVLFPLWWQFYSREYYRLRRVAFPLWWQFDDPRRKTFTRILFPLFFSVRNDKEKTHTIVTVPPLFWQVADKDVRRSGFLNVSLLNGKSGAIRFWTFELFPFVTLGKPPAPEGARWSFLHGLLGWRRQGATRELKLFWIPFRLPTRDHN